MHPETLRTGLVEPAIALGLQAAVTLTPNAGRWLRANGELDQLEALTRLPVRGAPRLPTEPRPHPVADCYVGAPASANYAAKLAMGIVDNQALTQASEALGTIGVPVVVFPRVNAAHARHPAWQGHIEALRKANVDLVYGSDVWPLYEPREGPVVRELPWPTIMKSIEQVATQPARHPHLEFYRAGDLGLRRATSVLTGEWIPVRPLPPLSAVVNVSCGCQADSRVALHARVTHPPSSSHPLLDSPWSRSRWTLARSTSGGISRAIMWNWSTRQRGVRPVDGAVQDGSDAVITPASTRSSHL
ncbi:flavoprotein [Streptomyces sp. NPDC005071]